MRRFSFWDRFAFRCLVPARGPSGDDDDRAKHSLSSSRAQEAPEGAREAPRGKSNQGASRSLRHHIGLLATSGEGNSRRLGPRRGQWPLPACLAR